MASEKTFTYDDVAGHKTKKDLYVVIHDEVYDCTSFIDEHPGGEEVLLDIAGKDATEAFEDVGHSDEAREILQDLSIGNLFRRPGEEKPAMVIPASPATSTPLGTNERGPFVYFLLLIVLVVGSGAYYYL
ncbi:cytochrome b5-like heme/steroid binding domain-containing protein [Mariannaea sp. PMI_226]|nr:cytochrome b5-like heme/steroid binding domain-containing protein [Mariannaea sp. PMI_226]